MNQYWAERWKRKSDEEFFKYLSAMATIYASRKWRKDLANGTTAHRIVKTENGEKSVIVPYGEGEYSTTRLFIDYKKWSKEQENIEP